MSDESQRGDELISAYLDGEATPAEVAEVEADDALLARAEQLRAVRDAVAAPVTPPAADQRDQLISAALAVADASDAARHEAKVVPLHRPRRVLLAVAAAAILLAAVVSAGLIAGRDDRDTFDMAAESSTAAPAAAEAPMDSADEAMAEEEPASADAGQASATTVPRLEEPAAEAAMDSADEAMAEEDPEPQMEMPAEEATADPGVPTEGRGDEDAGTDDMQTEDDRHSESTAAAAEPDAGDPAGKVVDLGTLENLESLAENIGASWSAALEDGAMADPGACSAAVDEQALELNAETLQSFVATIGAEDPVTFDARFARRPDGTAVIIYAAPPDCEIETQEMAGS